MPGCRPSCCRTAVSRTCGALGPLIPPGPPAPHEDRACVLAFAPCFPCRGKSAAVSPRGAHWLPGGRAERTGWDAQGTGGCAGLRLVVSCRWGDLGPSRRGAPAAAASCPATGTTRRSPRARPRDRAPVRPAHPRAAPCRAFQPEDVEPGRLAPEPSAGGAPRGRGAARAFRRTLGGRAAGQCWFKGRSGPPVRFGP
jgi:hypothetical protein